LEEASFLTLSPEGNSVIRYNCNKKMAKFFTFIISLLFVYSLYSWFFDSKPVQKIIDKPVELATQISTKVESLKIEPKKIESQMVEKKVSGKTFVQWKEACQKLPMPNTIAADAKDVTKFGKSALTKDQLEMICNQFIDAESNRFAKESLWLDSQLNDFTKKRFFAEKLILPHGSKLAIHADIHADIHSLMKYMDNLAISGYLQKDSWKIKDPNFYIVFLGNYAGIGYYGAEVLYTVMRLKLENPERVILVKGNHESVKNSGRFGFFKELEHKFGYKSKDLEKLCEIYHYYPIVICLGSANGDKKDFALLCHGGLEPGYNPKPLLADARKHVCEGIEKLNVSWVNSDVKRRMKKAVGMRFVPDWLYPKVVRDIGFRWSYFIIDDGSEYLTYTKKNNAVNFGKEATIEFLNEYSSEKNKVRSVIRGHQYLDNMVEKMLKHHGIYNSWSDIQWSGKEGEALNLAKGVVWTLKVSPGTTYGQNPKLDYDTYAILKVTKEFKDWQLEPHNVKVIQA